MYRESRSIHLMLTETMAVAHLKAAQIKAAVVLPLCVVLRCTIRGPKETLKELFLSMICNPRTCRLLVFSPILVGSSLEPFADACGPKRKRKRQRPKRVEEYKG